MDSMIKLTLPIPVSVNAAYLNRKNGKGRGRIKSPLTHAYWQQAYVDSVKQFRGYQGLLNKNIALRGSLTPAQLRSKMKKDKIKMPWYNMDVKYFFADDTRARDLTNYEKVMIDWLVDAGVLLDDQFIQEFNCKLCPPDKKNPRVQIIIFFLERYKYMD